MTELTDSLLDRDLDLGAVKNDSAKNHVIDTQLPGYLNRFDYQKNDSDGSHSDSDSLRKNGKSISSDGMDDSGMGSASDSGRRTGNSDSEPDTSLSEKPKKKKINERSVDTENNGEGLTYEQIQQNTQMKRPKRNGSTLSRFSHIFKNDGKKLSDTLTEEFRLNDRFSGLSMDRIWGGFLQQLREEEQSAKTPSKQRSSNASEDEDAARGSKSSESTAGKKNCQLIGKMSCQSKDPFP
ncbi:Oidioi.mRNA.OKI2018_I69.chr2.g4833.t2.cds [Oikopleura dioica]|uniref:Oidioi.mRNA.OKI2018_I69.chr2.g4833.t2.cds n=1 Tax=Oikopleura dioica TaxID=34765 RepID=A0ABN7SY61_OIKDI|nr:Oidioi.mRNA.OKI2018_I69.chr2.g4833.t2.cds [Oikopleura dioica]